MKNQLTTLFEANPSRERAYSTSDGMIFWRFADASAHGRALKDTEVEGHNRDGDSEDVSVEPNNIRAASTASFYDETPGAPKSSTSILDQKPDPKTLEEMTVDEVGKWAEAQTEVDELGAALEIVKTVGGKSHLNARIIEIEK